MAATKDGRLDAALQHKAGEVCVFVFFGGGVASETGGRWGDALLLLVYRAKC